MSVLIKGLEIPEEGAIRVVIQKHRGITVAYTGGDPYQRAHEVVELPEKHGRLVDADAFAEHLRETVKSVEAFAPQMAMALEAAVRDLEDPKKTPTIVEAEGEK